MSTAARYTQGHESIERDARARLEQAALELYRERGFQQTTVAEIANRAGLTRRRSARITRATCPSLRGIGASVATAALAQGSPALSDFEGAPSSSGDVGSAKVSLTNASVDDDVLTLERSTAHGGAMGTQQSSPSTRYPRVARNSRAIGGRWKGRSEGNQRWREFCRVYRASHSRDRWETT